jgi:hypothetical protein
MAPDQISGTCLCGANDMSARGPAGTVTACHCPQCRKTSGNFAASFDVADADLVWERSHWTTYATPAGGVRAFCPICGTKLWFRAADGSLSVEAGWITSPTGGRLQEHIFMSSAPGWDRPGDGLPQYEGWGTT